MEASIRNLLVGQVSTHLKTLSVKERVRELIYTHFLPQCNQHEISEDEFYKLILKPAFREADPAPEEDPDPANRKGTFVKVFNTTAHSLKRLGAILFEDPVREKIYFEDVTFLKAHVDMLEDADLAITYADLYKSEDDTEKRYLKICYKLNPALPYRIGGELYNNLKELLAAGFKSRELMNKIYVAYETGKLHIWLLAQDPDNFPALPEQPTLQSFLSLVYSVDAAFPFYFEQEVFYTPLELVAKAQNDLRLWEKLLAYCANGSIFVWFDALGYPDWRKEFQKALNNIQQDNLIEKDEKAYATVQQLLYIIHPAGVRPLIVASKAKIEQLNLEATKPFEVPVKLALKTLGFIKVRIQLEPACEGIGLDKDQATFFDLTEHKTAIVTLRVDPQRLDKNVAYQLNLQIASLYETISIPVHVKAVFPLRTFWIYLTKYSLLGAVFFGFFRWLLAAGLGHADGLAPRIITGAVGRSLPENYLIFYGVFVAMLAGFVLSVAVIRKVEKI